MHDFEQMVASSERWLMCRVLEYARARGYSRYTSTLEEAWRASIAGLSDQLLAAFRADPEPHELSPDEDYTRDPSAAFGILEARRHRSRGITLPMFLGLTKYYRQSYLDLVAEAGRSREEGSRWALFVNRFFDRLELGFVSEWTALAEEQKLVGLQEQNRTMTNEKNKYLTIFESLSKPVFVLNADNALENLNHAAATLFLAEDTPGAAYYRERPATELFPWLYPELGQLQPGDGNELSVIKPLPTRRGTLDFQIRMRPMLDVSGKFQGTTVMLTDMTELRRAWAEVKALSRLLPICSHCKKVRNDQGYWQQVEVYFHEHAEADFTHSVCPGCRAQHYPHRREERH